MGLVGDIIRVRYIGDVRELLAANEEAAAATGGLGSKMASVAKVGALALAAGVVIAGKALYDFTKVAATDQASQVKLQTTLKNTTDATKAQRDAVEEWIVKQSELKGVSDEELRPALSRLLTATHDTTSAQKLLNLAMDVSAGTGKSLDSVSLALMKGYNGQVSGLSRLGIKTTDAAGETMKFRDIVKEMSDTFKGQAAASADTLEGKMARLHAIFHQIEVKVGSALIPVLTNLADWFIKTGLPDVEKFMGGIEDLAHAISHHQWGKVFGLIKDAASKVLTGILDDVKDFGAHKLLPAITHAVTRAHASWSHEWDQFWKDPAGAYNRTITQTHVFGNNLVGTQERNMLRFVFVSAKGFNALPGIAGRTGVQTAHSWQQAINGMPALTGAIMGNVIGSIVRNLERAPGFAGRIGVNTTAALLRGLRAAAGGAGQIGVDIIMAMAHGVTSTAGYLASAAASAVINALNAAKSKIGGLIPGHAQGTSSFRGGLTWVGEEGPELVALPGGSRIVSNSTSRSIAGSAGSDDDRPILVKVLIDGREVHQALVRRKKQLGTDLGLA